MPLDPVVESSRNMEYGKLSEQSIQSASETSVDSNSLLNSELSMAVRELNPTKRERRKSPATSFGSDNTSTSVQAPMSPTSSLADLTFEPTIDMMVNDFDDEATLNEEEALADLEAHNPEDEIATLREESEMPLEELLAKYSVLKYPEVSQSTASSSRRSAGSRVRREQQRQQPYLERVTQRVCPEVQQTEIDQISEGSGDGVKNAFIGHPQYLGAETVLGNSSSTIGHFNDGVKDTEKITAIIPSEALKNRHRSHLLDLYPEESFGDSPRTNVMDELESFTPLETLFDDVEEDDDTDTDSDNARKIIMVGSDYQAEIPEGLSQYGDILPYENEDQLIWEPSQVSEREVENYLTKLQETRSILATEDASNHIVAEVGEANITLPTGLSDNVAATVTDKLKVHTVAEVETVVKDNEQGLHLLVQCGYDFKEALRRKRLNVLPLSDTMGSWSEEECLKFEEGIQKFGKDFYQIRQNQVRTRTMRELVQFYYLWKKSERRDQSFALNDTIDHMDVFINESGERSGNENGNTSSNGVHMHDTMSPRKSAAKSFSIMTGNNNNSTTAPGTSRKRGPSASLEVGDNEDDILTVGTN